MRAETASQAIKRATGAVAATLVGAFALIFVLLATLAVTLAGVVIATGALLARFATPARRRAGEPALLEGRRTPDGWVVEAAPPSV